VEHEKECQWQLGAVSESVESEEGWFIIPSIFLPTVARYTVVLIKLIALECAQILYARSSRFQSSIFSNTRLEWTINFTLPNRPVGGNTLRHARLLHCPQEAD